MVFILHDAVVAERSGIEGPPPVPWLFPVIHHVCFFLVGNGVCSADAAFVQCVLKQSREV